MIAKTSQATVPVIHSILCRVTSGELGAWEAIGERLLAEDELSRWRRFRHEPSRQMFFAGRLLLRSVLGHKLGCPPVRVPLQLTAKGKPWLAGVPGSFNLSHSHGWLLMVLSDQLELGVDLEQANSNRDLQGLAGMVMTAGEQSSFNALPAVAREDYFFRLWTAKEALVKQVGTGLGHGLQKICLNPALTGFEAPYDTYGLLRLSAPTGFHASVVYGIEAACAKPLTKEYRFASLGDCIDIDGHTRLRM